MIYNIIYSDAANNDLAELADVIIYKFQAPLTSFLYVRELRKVVHSLKHSPESYPVQSRASLQ